MATRYVGEVNGGRTQFLCPVRVGDLHVRRLWFDSIKSSSDMPAAATDVLAINSSGTVFKQPIASSIITALTHASMCPVVIGASATGAGTKCVTMGCNTANSATQDAILIGSDSTANAASTFSVVIGNAITATDVAASVLVGYGAVSANTPINSVGVGRGVEMRADQCVVIGDTAKCFGTGAVVVGPGACTAASSAMGASVVVGNGAGRQLKAGECTIVGGNAVTSISGTAADVTGARNTCVGTNSGYSLSSAADCTFVGRRSGMQVSTGSQNVFVGSGTGSGGAAVITGAGNTVVGYNSGFAMRGAAAANTLAGSLSGSGITDGLGNTILGALAGTSLTTNDDCVFVGWKAGATVTEGETVAIGSEAYGGTGAFPSGGCVAIGTRAAKTQTALSCTSVGFEAAIDADGDGCVGVGYRTGPQRKALSATQLATYVGMQAGLYTSGSFNTALGGQALLGVIGSVLTGENNTGVGAYALAALRGTSTRNTCVGKNAGVLLETANRNTYIGSLSGSTPTSVDDATAVGDSSHAGTDCCALGSGATTNANTNSTALGKGATATASNVCVIPTSQSFGVGTTAPTAKLHVVGSVILNDASVQMPSLAAAWPGEVVGNNSGTLVKMASSMVLQMVVVEVATLVTVNTITTIDNSAVSFAETQTLFGSATVFTPKRTGSRISVEGSLSGFCSAAMNIIGAIFVEDSGTLGAGDDAKSANIGAGCWGAGVQGAVSTAYTFTSTGAAKDIEFRMGVTNGSFQVNGNGGAQIFNGTHTARMVITEYMT